MNSPLTVNCRELRPNMAALVEGQHYGLSSNLSPHDQKTVVQVRLTDSALKAIEEYLKLKVNSSCFIQKCREISHTNMVMAEENCILNNFQLICFLTLVSLVDVLEDCVLIKY